MRIEFNADNKLFILFYFIFLCRAWSGVPCKIILEQHTIATMTCATVRALKSQNDFTIAPSFNHKPQVIYLGRTRLIFHSNVFVFIQSIMQLLSHLELPKRCLGEVGKSKYAIFANCLYALELEIVITNSEECLLRTPNGRQIPSCGLCQFIHMRQILYNPLYNSCHTWNLQRGARRSRLVEICLS